MPRPGAAVVVAALIVLDLTLSWLLARSALREEVARQAVTQAGSGSRDAFEAQARARSSAPVYVPTFSAYLSPISFTAAGLPSNRAVRTGHSVWVVTVRSPSGGCEGCALERPLRRNHAYSVVYDAVTGQEVDYCGGCEWLKESRLDTPVEHALSLAPDWLMEGVAWTRRAR